MLLLHSLLPTRENESKLNQEPSIAYMLISFITPGSKFMIFTKCFLKLKIYKVLSSCVTPQPFFPFGMLFSFVSKFPILSLLNVVT